MNWISNFVRPKINSLFSRREVPENLWRKCVSEEAAGLTEIEADSVTFSPMPTVHMAWIPVEEKDPYPVEKSAATKRMIKGRRSPVCGRSARWHRCRFTPLAR